jgi:hypothetical protein
MQRHFGSYKLTDGILQFEDLSAGRLPVTHLPPHYLFIGFVDRPVMQVDPNTKLT